MSNPQTVTDRSKVSGETDVDRNERIDARDPSPLDPVVGGPDGSARAVDSSGEEPARDPSRARVQRTPLRPAGSLREVHREVTLGLVTGVGCFALGLKVVHWTFVRWMTAGGSSTVMAASVLLPVAMPIVVGSILGERGRKAFGYAMITGVALGSLLGASYLFARFRTPAAAGPLALPG